MYFVPSVYLLFQYLEMRFDSKVRVMASALYIIQMVFYTSVAVFAPALALSHGKLNFNWF
jgi:hypothetical protein